MMEKLSSVAVSIGGKDMNWNGDLLSDKKANSLPLPDLIKLYYVGVVLDTIKLGFLLESLGYLSRLETYHSLKFCFFE